MSASDDHHHRHSRREARREAREQQDRLQAALQRGSDVLPEPITGASAEQPPLALFGRTWPTTTTPQEDDPGTLNDVFADAHAAVGRLTADDLTPRGPAKTGDRIGYRSPLTGPLTGSASLEADQAEAHRQDADLTARFLTFHQANPDVYRRLRDLALAGRRGGHTRGSIAMLYEVVRYEAWSRTGPFRDVAEGEHRLNNSYRSRYARLLMEAEPDLAGFFDTRELRTT